MTITIDREDAMALVLGTGGPGAYVHPFTRFGELRGFPNERWGWNHTYLKTLPTYKLYELYQELKAFNSRGISQPG